jgi:hypothetical protein
LDSKQNIYTVKKKPHPKSGFTSQAISYPWNMEPPPSAGRAAALLPPGWQHELAARGFVALPAIPTPTAAAALADGVLRAGKRGASIRGHRADVHGQTAAAEVAGAPPPGVAAASTWAESVAKFPTERNFLLEGECTPTSGSTFRFPSAAAIVDELRRHPGTRISTGAPRAALDLGTDAETLRFAEWFRAAPLEQALGQPFALAHFGLEAFDV